MVCRCLVWPGVFDTLTTCRQIVTTRPHWSNTTEIMPWRLHWRPLTWCPVAYWVCTVQFRTLWAEFIERSVQPNKTVAEMTPLHKVLFFIAANTSYCNNDSSTSDDTLPIHDILSLSFPRQPHTNLSLTITLSTHHKDACALTNHQHMSIHVWRMENCNHIFFHILQMCRPCRGNTHTYLHQFSKVSSWRISLLSFTFYFHGRSSLVKLMPHT